MNDPPPPVNFLFFFVSAEAENRGTMWNNKGRLNKSWNREVNLNI